MNSNNEQAKTPKRQKNLPLLAKRRFPQFRNTTGWNKQYLYELADPIVEKATKTDTSLVLTLSADYGIVPQGDYFGKKIAGENLERYVKIVRNDFVYNDRTTKAYPFGTIKRLGACESGLVSPIYKCFRFKTGENPGFWNWYFESGFHEEELKGLVNEGARTGRFNISIEKFLSIGVWLPSSEEQQKIANCFDSLDALITAQTRKLDALKTHKKGLMQQLFPSPEDVEV